jgi:hypothetical protein
VYKNQFELLQMVIPSMYSNEKRDILYEIVSLIDVFTQGMTLLTL